MSCVKPIFYGINRVLMATSGAMLFVFLGWFFGTKYFDVDSLIVRAAPETGTIVPWILLATLVVFGIVYSSRWTAWSRTSPLVQMAMRFYAGWAFVEAGLHKIRGGNASWLNTSTPLHAFWTKALTPAKAGVKAAAANNAHFHDFLTYANNEHWFTWFAKVIALGEVAAGAGLILGVFVGLASIGGVTMNLAFMESGSISSNPEMLMLGIAIFVMQVIQRRQASFLTVENWARTKWETRKATAAVPTYEPAPAYTANNVEVQGSSAD